jgi:ferredoxin/flavodoxin---NADP+ reductase
MSMCEIVRNELIGPQVYLIELKAPKIARKRRAGQFVIVRPDEAAERVPLTIADSDVEAGTITLIVQAVGRSTEKLVALAVGQTVRDVVGPLGEPTHIGDVKRACVIGGGIGTAVAMPIARAMKEAGAHVTAIIGARSKDLVILEEHMKRLADRVIVCTDDGSYGRKGLVTEMLDELLAAGEKFDEALAIGPVPMMEAVCKVTRQAGIRTIVSLNPIMIDGTGMCGGCRVTVGGKTRFACVDGPEFDGHEVDFAELRTRLGAFRDLEAEARKARAEDCRIIDAAKRLEKQE